ncbi:protein PF14_0175-like [Bombus pyrosoma]|uniref:protein PF14_0175-like n=1 Tax=Bombus pyrosoma TaxID=396416 RepID=UPI001CB8F98E|nr:protein PF14_0175-like [Bombus pyrosoma]
MNSNNFSSHNRVQNIYNKKRFSCENYKKEKPAIVSIIYKENQNYNTTLDSCANENQNILMNSTIRSTLSRRNYEKCQEDLSISQKNTLESTSIVNRVLNKCDRNTSVFLLGNYRNNNKLGMTKTPNIIEDDHKAVLNHDLQNIMGFCNKSNANCNLYNKNKIHCEQNVKFQQKSLSIISQQRSVEAKTHGKRNQSNATNEADCNISIQTTRENSCDISESITTEESRKGVYTKGKRQRTIKSTCHLQIKKDKQKKIYSTVYKYKQCNKVTKNKLVIGKRNDTSNFSTVTIIPSSKIDTKVNKDIARHKHCIDIKNLIIPLIKIDDLSTSELSKLIQSTKSIENKENIQKDENICNETKNIAKIQHSAYKKCKTTEFKQEQKINILYKSVFEERCTKFEENVVNKINQNIRNIKFGKETYKISPENILQFFLKNRRDIDIRTRLRSSIENIYEYHIRKSVAMCSKCTEAFNLLRQFSGKVNFVQNEKVCIECTLCNLQINSLFHFQKHLMDIHLQCERKSLRKQKKFAVTIINFSDQLDLNINNKFIFECCCCSKVFDHITNFEEHIKNMHHDFNHYTDNVKKCEAGQMTVTSESYTTFKNEQVFNETCVLDKNYIFDAPTNIDEISNSGKEINIQNNHINEYDINTKEIILYHTDSNDKNLLSEMKVKDKQINNINNSDVTQIRKENQKFKEDIEILNIDEKYSNSISKLNLSNVSIKIDQRFKEYWKHKRSFSFICKVCFKKYKRKQAFLSHMSKHITDFDTNIHEQQKSEENNDLIRHENDVVLNAYTKTSQDDSESFKDNNVPHSTINLAESDQNTLISKTIGNEVDSGENGNVEYDIKEDSVASKTDDCNFALYINLTHTQKTGNDAKRQKLIKFNMNITKKRKTSTNEQQSTENEIGNMFPTNFTTNTNSIMDASKENVSYGLKELHCIICDKKFSSLTIFKEHMFFLHDSLFEDPRSSDLSMTPYKVKNLSTCQIKESKKVLQKENKQKYRKWRCNACKENFALLRNYLRHKYYYHNDESVVHICDNCNKILTSVAMVNIHMCTNVTTWNCKRCSLTFSNGISLTQHNMNYHVEKIGPHVCKICKLNFLTMYMLTRHEATHSISNNSNVTETLIDLSVPAKDYLPYTGDNINVNSEFSRKQLNDKAIPYRNENVEIKELDELSEKLSEMHITSNIPHNDKNILHCNTLRATALQFKLHLEKRHKREICRICNSLYFTDKLIKHLISDHIVSNNVCFRENDANIEITQGNINSQNDIIKILGIKRLFSLYEYQRFDTIEENKCFSCITCSKQFSDTQQYKVHYLKYHDTMCLLCNIKFEHNFQALEHKIKIHESIDLYLWIAQKLILQLKQYGSIIEDVILKSSEIRVC